jgi:hypothetical protein
MGGLIALVALRIAGRDFRGGAGAIGKDRSSQLVGVGVGGEAFQGNAHESGVAEPARAVGVGELFRLGHFMDSRGGKSPFSQSGKPSRILRISITCAPPEEGGALPPRRRISSPARSHGHLAHHHAVLGDHRARSGEIGDDRRGLGLGGERGHDREAREANEEDAHRAGLCRTRRANFRRCRLVS